MKIKDMVDIEIQDENMMIYDSENDYLIEINEIGKIIIEMIRLDTNVTAIDIEKAIQKEYDCRENNILSDINEFVSGMTELGIIL